jgi:riboflavin synthase
VFTGIVKAVGAVAAMDRSGQQARVRITCPELSPGRFSEGDSIAVAGCCLTALGLDAEGFSADLSPETLARTSLGKLAEGSRVNLEPALALGDSLGGHLVTGHVDGLAELIAHDPVDDNTVMTFTVPDELSRYIAVKGSVTLDGVSLTVNSVSGHRFTVNLVPHTLKVTTLGTLEVGDRVNLEIDLIARYLERMLGYDKH